MKNLFFVRRKDEVAFVYCPVKECTWRGSWMPASVLEKTDVTLEYVKAGAELRLNRSASDLNTTASSNLGKKKRRSGNKEAVPTWDGPSGWIVRDCSPAAAKAGTIHSIMLVPSMDPESQDPEYPPMGLWSKPGADFRFRDSSAPEDADSVHTLMERSSFPADRLQPTPPYTIELPFAKLDYYEKDISLVRLDITPCKVAIDDKGAEELLTKLNALLLSIARRPGVRLHIVLDAENAAVPAMRHVKRLLSWSNGEGSELLFVTVRGFVTVLKPKGFTGMALLQVLQFIQKVAPALWPEKVAPSHQEADSFLAALPVPAAADCGETAGAEIPSILNGVSKPMLPVQSDSAGELLSQDALPSSPDIQKDSSPTLAMSSQMSRTTFADEDSSPLQKGTGSEIPIQELAHDGGLQQCNSCGSQCCIS